MLLPPVASALRAMGPLPGAAGLGGCQQPPAPPLVAPPAPPPSDLPPGQDALLASVFTPKEAGGVVPSHVAAPPLPNSPPLPPAPATASTAAPVVASTLAPAPVPLH